MVKVIIINRFVVITRYLLFLFLLFGRCFVLITAAPPILASFQQRPSSVGFLTVLSESLTQMANDVADHLDDNDHHHNTHDNDDNHNNDVNNDHNHNNDIYIIMQCLFVCL